MTKIPPTPGLVHRCERCPRYEKTADLVVCEDCLRMVCPQCVHRDAAGQPVRRCVVCDFRLGEERRQNL